MKDSIYFLNQWTAPLDGEVKMLLTEYPFPRNTFISIISRKRVVSAFSQPKEVQIILGTSKGMSI